MKKNNLILLIHILSLLSFSSCLDNHKKKQDITTKEHSEESYDLDHLQEHGELIAVTISGPDTYYEYKGKGMGLQYELCLSYAKFIGARLRMETVHDTTTLFNKLIHNEADIIALEMSHRRTLPDECCFAGPWSTSSDSTDKCQWIVRKNAPLLKTSLDEWYKPAHRTQLLEKQSALFRPLPQSKKAHAPILDRKKGIISPYDATFIRVAPNIGWDWRLLAAQCYQESGFDAQAVSWAGAIGLMQIMPETASHLKVHADHLYQPEKNIQTAAHYIKHLNNTFSDIKNRLDRIHFILAAYNGGAGHVRDAMTLARKHGKNPQSWNDVAPFILRLSLPAYYNDPDVNYGYLRGEETYQYVHAIINRWEQYKKAIPGAYKVQPRPATSRQRKR